MAYQQGLGEDEAAFKSMAVVRMSSAQSVDQAWQALNQNFLHYVAAWKGTSATLKEHAQTEGNGIAMGAKYRRVTSTTHRVKQGNSHRTITRSTTMVYTCTHLDAPNRCTFEVTTKIVGGNQISVGHDDEIVHVHFVHQPSKSADGGFDLAITFTSTGAVQPLLCRILCFPCMLTGCIDMERENRKAVENGASHMAQQAQQIINGGPMELGAAAAQPGEKSLADKIKEISELKDQGILSEEEFTAAKAALIAGN